MIDVSVVLNMHREALYLVPTLKSLVQCAARARDEGVIVELVAVFDRADDATREVFRAHDLSVFVAVKEVDVDVGSLGLARNAGIGRADGEYVWTSDADDLVSSNAIVALLAAARGHGRAEVAVFLEYLCAFGEQYHNVRYVDSKFLTAGDFAFQHPYVSRIFIRRSAFDSLKYDDLRVTTGFAYEDWYFNCQLRAAGYDMIVAPDTVIFYRQRPGSLLRQANAASVRLIPHSRLFDPEMFLADMRESRRRAGDWNALLADRKAIFAQDNTRLFMESESLQESLWEAIQLEPEIEPHRVEVAGSYSPMPWNPEHWGMQLEHLYGMIGKGRFTDIVLLPWLIAGGAEKYILQVLHEIAAQQPEARILVIAGQAAKRHDWVAKLPKGSVFIDICNAFPHLDSADQDALTIRMLLAIREGDARLHVKSSPFAHRLLDAYAPVLTRLFRIVYYRFSDATYRWRDTVLRGPWGMGVLRRHLPGFWRVLTDCEAIIEADRSLLGPLPSYHPIYARCDVSSAAIAAGSPGRLGTRRKLLWASRVAPEKRPELLSAISERLAAQGVDVKIDAFGTADPGVNAKQVFDQGQGRIRYRGGFSSFSELPLGEYDAFLYTSSFDGLPNILLEMAGAGLPIIAPDVGGISELVKNGVTGRLIPSMYDDASLVEAYVEAVLSLYAEGADWQGMSEACRSLIETRHGAGAFAGQVRDVLCLAPEKSSKVV
ncbi:glycosyltransferase [Stenotrophomonas maltophilia]|uniref:glycosyltransferase n=1 Tax=Stenotrophomonas maltophilia TaxID=40324 RepID=UPI0013DD0668|nr:glycosyltransferase [Stenotrophomonas maltophilia]